MSDLPDLSKMIGPLPLGAWVGVVGGGLGLMWYTRRQSASAAPTASFTDSGTVDQYEDVSVPTGVGAGPGGFTYVPPGSDTGTVSTEPDTNESWARRAVNGLIALGYDPAVSDSAIRKYMEGAQLGASEYALVTIALGKYGAPPVLLPAPVFGPPTMPRTPAAGTPSKGKPVPAPKPKPVSKPHVRYYTVKPGDTLSKIGKHFGVSWQSIFNANRTGKKRADGSRGIISNANRISIGWKLIIPNN